MDRVDVYTQAELEAAIAAGQLPVCRGNYRMVAGGSAHVEAWGSAHVVAWGSAQKAFVKGFSSCFMVYAPAGVTTEEDLHTTMNSYWADYFDTSRYEMACSIRDVHNAWPGLE